MLCLKGMIVTIAKYFNKARRLISPDWILRAIHDGLAQIARRSSFVRCPATLGCRAVSGRMRWPGQCPCPSYPLSMPRILKQPSAACGLLTTLGSGGEGTCPELRWLFGPPAREKLAGRVSQTVARVVWPSGRTRRVSSALNWAGLWFVLPWRLHFKVFERGCLPP